MSHYKLTQNMDGNFTKNVSPTSGLLTEAQYIIVLESCYIVWVILSFMGVLSNIVNIRTFIVMGLTDGVTISFFALAIFDLTYLIASLSLAVSVSLYVCELKLAERYRIEPFAVLVFSASVMILVNITNTLTTTFLAVVRCMCVAMPLHFKNTFTIRKAIVFMVGVAIFAVVIYIPILINMGMTSQFDKLINTTRHSLWMSPTREHVKKNVWVVTEMILPVVTQVVIIVCILVMARSLRAASKFRQASAPMSIKSYTSTRKENISHKNDNIEYFNDTSSVADKLTGKDLRVVQQVVLISVVYIVCNVPKILISFFTTLEPEFTVGHRYSRLYMSVNCLRKHFEIINAGVNFIIYYKYNTKFRSCC